MQGKITPLSEVRPINTLYNIHVRVSRTWEYRGKSEKNPLIHFDMVVIDQKGYAMYCEAPPEVLPQFKQYLEGKVLYIWKACVERAKPGYRVVDAPYMLKLIMRTEIFEGNSNEHKLPKKNHKTYKNNINQKPAWGRYIPMNKPAWGRSISNYSVSN
ncbi:uncharacterized protein [Miscanthus floridulus]|uniref:uncharacterized protein isoform X2 n=1 Tax=Miscanthus floridulus TaxID=154761 RepID=UPI00345A4E29